MALYIIYNFLLTVHRRCYSMQRQTSRYMLKIATVSHSTAFNTSFRVKVTSVSYIFAWVGKCHDIWSARSTKHVPYSHTKLHSKNLFWHNDSVLYHVWNSNVTICKDNCIARCRNWQNVWEVDSNCNREHQVDWMHLKTIGLSANTCHNYQQHQTFITKTTILNSATILLCFRQRFR